MVRRSSKFQNPFWHIIPPNEIGLPINCPQRRQQCKDTEQSNTAILVPLCWNQQTQKCKCEEKYQTFNECIQESIRCNTDGIPQVGSFRYPRNISKDQNKRPKMKREGASQKERPETLFGISLSDETCRCVQCLRSGGNRLLTDFLLFCFDTTFHWEWKAYALHPEEHQ